MAEYLPGINVTLNDLGLKVAPPPAGPKITLLGVTSNTGLRVREPYTVASVEKAMNTLYFDLPSGVAPGSIGLGTYGTNGRVPGELALAIEEAINAGAPNVEIMIINTLSGDALLDYLRPENGHAQRHIDLSGAYEVLRNRDLDVVVPVGVSIDSIFTGAGYTNYSYGKQLADFCFRSTQESNSAVGVISVMRPTEWAFEHRSLLGANTAYKAEIKTIFNLTGNSSDSTDDIMITGEWSNTDLFSNAKKKEVYAGIEFGVLSAALINEWHAYHAYPGDLSKSAVSITNTANYAVPYLHWLYGAADQDGNMLSNTSDNASRSVKTSYFTSWQAVTSEGALAVDARSNKVDAGAYISVFSAPLRSIGTLVRSVALGYSASPANTSRNTSGAAAYGGKIINLAPQSSTTNKQIDGLTAMRLLSARQANDMTGMRHVTMYSRTKGLTVASGTTGAFNVTKYVRSDYTRLTTMRIVAAAADLIRAVGDKYIGEPNNAPQMNALDAEIDQLLLSMKGQGALNSYDFSISSTPDQRVLGQLDINLTLVPAFEITEINLVVSLSKEL
jgi:hypothetical protein